MPEPPTVALGAVVSSAKNQNIPVERCTYATSRASLHDESELLHHAAALEVSSERPSSRTPRVSSELPTVALGADVSSTKKQNIPVATCAYATSGASLHDESELLHHEAALEVSSERPSSRTP